MSFVPSDKLYKRWSFLYMVSMSEEVIHLTQGKGKTMLYTD